MFVHLIPKNQLWSHFKTKTPYTGATEIHNNGKDESFFITQSLRRTLTHLAEIQEVGNETPVLVLLHHKGGIQVEAIRRYNLQFTTPPPPNQNQETLIQMKTVNVLLFKAHTSSEHPTVVTTAAVRYERVMIGICLYHSSTPCAILISPPPS